MAVAKRRPPEARRELILDAAGKVFFEQTFSPTSVDAIITRLGGSKRTIYNEFGSKETPLITPTRRVGPWPLSSPTCQSPR
jgi:AcrR family transcriptional regulator